MGHTSESFVFDRNKIAPPPVKNENPEEISYRGFSNFDEIALSNDPNEEDERILRGDKGETWGHSLTLWAQFQCFLTLFDHFRPSLTISWRIYYYN